MVSAPPPITVGGGGENLPRSCDDKNFFIFVAG